MKFTPIKGVRDISPKEAKLREEILNTLKNVFVTFGFQPLETPSLESWEVLSAKSGGGPEILKETYNFKDKSGRKIGLIYDLTVPLARFVASNPNLPLPFKRYQVQKVWRYGDVSKGRLREFLQCDIDIVGSESMIADAEIVTCAIFALEKIGFKEFTVRLNNRKLLTTIVEKSGVDKKKVLDTLRILDKLEKIGISGVKEELKRLKISIDSIESLLTTTAVEDEPEILLDKLEKSIGKNEGISELREMISFFKIVGVENKVKIDLSLARGLDYYTGPIFEISAGKEIGSIAGGGRYDGLIEIFSGRKVPATGISFGIERILELIKDKKIKMEDKPKTWVFVAAVNEEIREKVFQIACNLRTAGIPTEIDLKKRSLTRQLEYADVMEIPYVVIVGKKEIEKNIVKLKDMSTGKETEVKLEELSQILGEKCL